MSEGKKANKIFISYAHKDFEKIKKYIAYLQNNYYDFWYDKNLVVSDRWRNVIGDQIKASNFFVAFYSSNYNDSAFCQTEFNLAKEDKERIIISIKIEKNFRNENSSIGLSDYQFLPGDDESEEEVWAQLTAIFPNLSACKKNRELLQKFDENASHQGSIIPFLNRTDYDLSLLFSYIFAFLGSCDRQKDIPFFKFEDIEIYTSGLNIYFNFKPSEEKIEENCVSFNLWKLINIILKNKDGEIYPSFYKKNDGKDSSGRSFIDNHGYIIEKLLSDEYLPLQSIDALFDYFKNLKASVGYLYNGKENYELNFFTLEQLRRKMIERLNDICEGGLKYPNLQKVDGGEKIGGLDENPLLKLVNEYDKDEELITKDVYVYGEAGSGKIYMIKDFVENYQNDVLYIDLMNASSACPSIVHDFLQSSNYFSGGFNFDANSLKNYVLTHHLSIVLYGLETLDEKQLSFIIDEIKNLSYYARIIILSRKRNLVSKIFLNNIKVELENFEYFDVNPYDEQTVKIILAEKIKRDFEDEKIIALLNSPSKMRYFLNAVLDENGEERREINNSSDLLFAYLFDENSPSISTKCKSLIRERVKDEYFIDAFKKNIDDVFESVAKWAFCKFIGENYAIDEKYFNFLIDFNLIDFNITDGGNHVYTFSHSEYEQYFIAYYIAKKLTQKSDSFDEFAVSIATSFKNAYSILQFVGYYLVSRKLLKSVIGNLLNVAKGSEKKNEIATLAYLIILLSDVSLLDEIDFDGLFCYVEEDTFRDSGLFSEIIIPSSVKEIKRAAFVNLNNLKYLNLGKGVEKIAPWAIINCPDLENIRFGKCVSDISAPLITNCDGLTSITVDKRNEKFSSEYKQGLVSKDKTIFFFACASLEEITLPEETKEIESWAFKGMKRLTSLHIPANVTKISTDFTDECPSLTEFTVDEKNAVFSVIDRSALICKNKDDRLVLFRLASGVEGEYFVPREIEVIGADAISTCRKLTNVFIPDSVVEIGNYALADLENTLLIEFEDIEALEKTGSFILMCHNPKLKIETDGRTVTPNGFTLTTRKNTSNDFKSDKFLFDKNCSFDELAKASNKFEICYDSKTFERGFNEVEIYRYVDLYRDNQSVENNYNVLLLGMVEYNDFVSREYKEIEEILEKLSVNCIILSRDLPCPRGILFACKDRISVYRSALGTTKISQEIQKICEEKR